MRRKNRGPFNEQKETKKLITMAISILIIAILAFTITFVIYSNYLNKNIKIAEVKKNNITDLGSFNTEKSSQASSSIGKSVNEVEEENTITNEVDNTKIAINTSNMEKESVKTDIQKEETKANTQKQNTETKKEEKVADPSFKKPVDGEITNEFAKESLIYSNTLQEWVTHNGIDIKADKTTIVKASAEGIIKSIKNDPRYGITVVIEHVNGFESVYSNLLTAEFVKEKENVKQGQTIGTVGNTATFEIADESHLHFEMLKDNEYLDPNLYLK